MIVDKLRPSGITADRNRKVLVITWNDGHLSEYPFAGLRAACPCAECRGEHENMGAPAVGSATLGAPVVGSATLGAPPDPGVFLIPLSPAKSDTLTDLQLVGNYALQFTWGDGHQYGIYTWDYLRGLCPCPEDMAR